MKNILTLTAIVEILTGLAMLIVPTLVGELLLGEKLIGVTIPIAKMLGIALTALGVACWPNCNTICGMLAYSSLATIYLTIVAFEGEFVGKLLWSAIVLHAILTALLVRSWLHSRNNDSLK